MNMTEYFIIISNMRSGSTYLCTSLGQLPQFSTDFELKYNPIHKLGKIHLLLKDSCKDSLQPIAKNKIVGSKLTFDSFSLYDPIKDYVLSDHDFSNLSLVIESDIKIIHLIRNYYDIIQSQRRGAFNILNNNSDIDYNKSVVSIELMNDPIYREKTKIHETQFRNLSHLQIRKNLFSLFVNDLYSSLIKQKKPNKTIEYNNIGNSFFDLAAFLSPEVTCEECEKIMNNPVTKKLQEIEYQPLSEEDAQLCAALFDEATQYAYTYPGDQKIKNRIEWARQELTEILKKLSADSLSIT